jgi:hypothetical protein
MGSVPFSVKEQVMGFRANPPALKASRVFLLPLKYGPVRVCALNDERGDAAANHPWILWILWYCASEGYRVPAKLPL